MALDDEDRAWIAAMLDERFSQMALPTEPPEQPSPEEIRAQGEADAERIRAAGEADVARIEAAADAAEQIEEAQAENAPEGNPDDDPADLDPSDASLLGVEADPEPVHWMERPMFRRKS